MKAEEEGVLESSINQQELEHGEGKIGKEFQRFDRQYWLWVPLVGGIVNKLFA